VLLVVHYASVPVVKARLITDKNTTKIKINIKLGVVVADRDTESGNRHQGQLSLPSLNRVPACLAGVMEGRVHLCRVAGNTV